MTRTRHVDLGGEGAGDRPAVVDVADGRRVAYATYGSPDGRPVLFFHGTPGSRLLGQSFDDAARRHGVNVLAPDRPGYGRSDPWSDFEPTDVGVVAEGILADANRSSAGVVGFSGGGRHALALAATRPDLVRGVDLVSGGVPPSLRETTPTIQRLMGTLARRTPGLLRGLFRFHAWVAARRSPSLVLAQYTTRDGRAEVPDPVAELVKRDFVEAVGPQQAGAVAETRGFTRDWAVPFEAVEHHVRSWHGGRDTNVPVDAARRLVERLPDSDLTVDETADHVTALLRHRSAILERQSKLPTRG